MYHCTFFVNFIQKWDVSSKSTQPNPDYVPVDLQRPQTDDDEDDDDEIPSTSTPSSQPALQMPSTGRRGLRRAVANEVVYNYRMCDFMEKILKITEVPTKIPFEKKVSDFCLVLENIMLKQDESVFDAFMIDVLLYAQEYNPTLV